MTYHSNICVGYGKSHASFGEILQGRLPQEEDFLVTLPIDMWSICNLTCIKRHGPLVINCEYSKSSSVAKRLLDKLRILFGYEITISFSRNIPVGKGLSSSTADMLSTIRAMQEVFGFLLREMTISEIFAEIEPHDGLMYKSCVVYNHRKGRLIKDLVYIPEYWIIAIDFGGEINTIEYNEVVTFDGAMLKTYSDLLTDLDDAFIAKDELRIAHVASRSSELHLTIHRWEEKLAVFKATAEFNPIGIVNTHSGTCLGLIYPRKKATREISDLAERIQQKFNRRVFVTNTLKLLL